MIENGGIFSEKDGVSCVFINTDKGKRMWENCSDIIESREVKFSNVAIVNAQLNNPAIYSAMRNKLLNSYRNDGYIGIQRIFLEWRIKKKFKRIVKRILPNQIVLKMQRKNQ